MKNGNLITLSALSTPTMDQAARKPTVRSNVPQQETDTMAASDDHHRILNICNARRDMFIGIFIRDPGLAVQNIAILVFAAFGKNDRYSEITVFEWFHGGFFRLPCIEIGGDTCFFGLSGAFLVQSKGDLAQGFVFDVLLLNAHVGLQALIGI
jgi:hypothetical protein